MLWSRSRAPPASRARSEALLADRSRAAELGRRALACAESKRGATERAIAVIRDVTADPARATGRTLRRSSSVGRVSRRGDRWRAGQCARNLRRRRRLNASVISVGNLTMGGTGKTPIVLYLAEQMRHAGRRPAF